VAGTVTDQEGYFFFQREPVLNTRYRVRTFDPAVVSEEPIVRVRLGVDVEASRRRVAQGRSVTFSGTVVPPHDAMGVLIQRKDERGRYRTVARGVTTLNPDGTAGFEKRVRLRSDGDFEFRVRLAGDADHLPGISAPVRVVVVPKRDRRRDR
jgi:hypothetical protein